MWVGDEVLLKAKVVGLENSSAESRIKVEISGLVCEVENHKELCEWRGSQGCGRVRFWIHSLDQDMILAPVK